MSTVTVSASRDRRVPASLARPRAHLITLWTRDRTPLLVLDPRAGSIVDRHVRSIHRPDLRVLAWSITGDEVLVLVARSASGRLTGVTRRLHDTTAIRLAALGHARPWAAEIPVLPIRPHHDLAALVEFVLMAPVRSGLADGWPEWRWAGSRQWPGINPAFLARHASDRLWLDAVTANVSHADRRPTESTTGTLRRRIEGRCLGREG